MTSERRSRAVAVALAVWAILMLAAQSMTASRAQAPDPFSVCREQFARNPEDYDAAYCFYEVTLQQSLWEEGARLFERLIEEHPGNFWLPMAYGHVYRSRTPDRAEGLYRRAADGFTQAKNAEGELLARSNLRNFLFPKGRVKDATSEMERVVAIGDSVEDPILKARAWTLEATHVQDTGGDLGLAYRLLKQTQNAIFPNGPYRLKRSCLNSLGLVAFRMGRLEEALAVFRELDDIATVEGEALVQANARFNILNTASLQESLLPKPGAIGRLMRLAENSLATAEAAHNREVTLKTHAVLAELLASDGGSRRQALGHVESCLDLARKTRAAHDEAICSWIEASLLRESAPDKARAAAHRALDAAARANSPRTQAYSAGRHMRFSWETKPRPEAIRDALEAIDSIETLRNLQDEAESSAELFSTWTFDYYWLSGRLLQDWDERDLELAFSITERMRARSLLDVVERSRTPPDGGDPAVIKRRELLEGIAAVQRRLMTLTGNADERRRNLQELERLELQEREARRRVAMTTPARPWDAPSFASLDAIQSVLTDNEALLAFQVGLWETYEGDFGGGSWLVTITRHHRSVHRLLDRAELAPMIPVFTGLIEREDGLEAASAVRLYNELLSEALSSLPPGITRLILVPDSVLHHLPFDTLRPGSGREPLAARFELVVAPSATLWLHSQSRAAPTTTGRYWLWRIPSSRYPHSRLRRVSETRSWSRVCDWAAFRTHVAKAGRSSATSVRLRR